MFHTSCDWSVYTCRSSIPGLSASRDCCELHWKKLGDSPSLLSGQFNHTVWQNDDHETVYMDVQGKWLISSFVGKQLSSQMFARFQWKLCGEILCPQEFRLFDDALTPRTVLQILSQENPSVYSDTHSNLDIEVISMSENSFWTADK